MLLDTRSQQAIDLPKRYTRVNHRDCVKLAGEIELWGAIDAFTLGQLGKFIMACDADVADVAERTWRKMARDMEINAGVFSTGIESLTVTRNLICHHARIWMRPANNSPKKPRVFEKDLRSVDPKSQLMAFANVALFQRPSRRREAWSEVLELVSSNALYKYGVSQTSHKEGKSSITL